jgi:threonine/homoserine/homoserine lactone efflux protein
LSGDPVFSFVYLILTGLVVGVLIAAPVGPVNVVCIQRTLERGFWGGFAAGLGAVLADGLIATVAAFGVTAISGMMEDHKNKLRLIGAAVMIVFGLRLLFAEPKVVDTARMNIFRLRRIVELMPWFLRPTLRLGIWRVVPHIAIIPQTFFLTITNLGAILGLFAIIGGIGSMTSGLNQTSHALTLVASIMSGSMLWWSGLSGLISRIRHKLNHNRLRMINQAAGGLLLVFGAVLFFQFTYGLLDYYQGQASVAR